MCNADNHQRYPRHELLGSRVFNCNETETCWQNALDIRQVSWLAEHVLLNQILFPAAGYVAMVGESIRQLSSGCLQSYAVKDFLITSALLLKRDAILNLRTRLLPVMAAGYMCQSYEFQIAAFDGNHWKEQCVGIVSLCSTPGLKDIEIPSLDEKLERHVSQAYWYEVLGGTGLKYGPAFQGLNEISTALIDHKATATVFPFGDPTKYILHPATIDQCFQILMAAASRGQGRLITHTSVVTAIEHLVVSHGGQGKSKIRGMAAKSRSGDVMGDVTVVSEEGRPIVSLKHCKTSPVPIDGGGQEEKLFSFVEWDTDATYCDLNQAMVPPKSQQAPSIVPKVLKLLAHRNPKLRILELGNGADWTTRSLLDALKSDYDERLYLTYTYAATSLAAAFRLKAAFKGARSINVVYFDIGERIRSPFLQAGAYDVIIATDFISLAKPKVTAYVDSLKYLLDPLGHILLLPGSIASKDERLLSQLYTSLLEYGFEFSPRDEDTTNAPRFIAKLRKPLRHPRKLTLVIPEDHHPLVDEIESSFRNHGIDCDRSTFERNMPQGQDMMLLVDFGKPYLYNLTEARFRTFVDHLSNFKGSIIWVTPSVQISCDNPNSSMTLGMTRTLRAEMRKDITVVEVDDEAATFLSSCQSLLKIYQNLTYRAKGGTVDPDYEYAIINGHIKIPRIHWTTGVQELSKFLDQSATDDSGCQRFQASNESALSTIRFRSDACYLLVGGLGGLGRMIATWMVENGAGSILFLSRSAKEGPETTPFFDELRALGCEVLTFAGDVTNLSDVKAALKQPTRPITGVMQMSAVMRDNLLSRMTFIEWDQCVRPKVQGTWNLHEATSSAGLDFFLLFSSICGMTGQWAQANYNSANAFLDAFVNYRHGQGLPASVVDVGAMRCVGMMTNDRPLLDRWAAGGYHLCSEKHLIDALIIAIAYSRPGKDTSMNKGHLGLGIRSTKPITDPSTRVVWKRDARMVFSHQFPALGVVTNDEAGEYLQAAFQNRETSS